MAKRNDAEVNTADMYMTPQNTSTAPFYDELHRNNIDNAYENYASG